MYFFVIAYDLDPPDDTDPLHDTNPLDIMNLHYNIICSVVASMWSYLFTLVLETEIFMT